MSLLQLRNQPVGLIQNEVGASPQIGLAHLEEVDETSGRGNADFDSILEVADLGSLRGSSEDAGVLNLGRPAKISLDLFDLLSQLSSRGQD